MFQKLHPVITRTIALWTKRPHPILEGGEGCRKIFNLPENSTTSLEVSL